MYAVHKHLRQYEQFCGHSLGRRSVFGDGCLRNFRARAFGCRSDHKKEEQAGRYPAMFVQKQLRYNRVNACRTARRRPRACGNNFRLFDTRIQRSCRNSIVGLCGKPCTATNRGSESAGIAGSPLIEAKTRDKNILLNIVKNPLIIGVAIGLVFVGIREIERACCGGEVVFSFKEHLKFIYTGVYDLKIIASPLALIILGGQFEFSAVKGMTKEIIVGTACRIVLAPLIGIGCAYLLSAFTGLFEFGTDVYPTLIALFATPVAVSSAIMAGEMGGDEQLANSASRMDEPLLGCYDFCYSICSYVLRTFGGLIFRLKSGAICAAFLLTK